MVWFGSWIKCISGHAILYCILEILELLHISLMVWFGSWIKCISGHAILNCILEILELLHKSFCSQTITRASKKEQQLWIK